eukprot:Skav221389  [mRNA]  locus=scaffold4031:47764:52397:+ [translate_table: standard]
MRLLLAVIQRRVTLLGGDLEQNSPSIPSLSQRLNKFSVGRLLDLLQNCQQVDATLKSELKTLVSAGSKRFKFCQFGQIFMEDLRENIRESESVQLLPHLTNTMHRNGPGILEANLARPDVMAPGPGIVQVPMMPQNNAMHQNCPGNAIEAWPQGGRTGSDWGPFFSRLAGLLA